MTIKDSSTFDSGAVTVADRPVGVVSIAGHEYDMRCPKLRVWIAMIERQEDYAAAQSLKPHIQEIYHKLSQNPSDEERTKLIEQYSVLQPNYSRAPTALQLADLLLDFLCTCMVDKPSGDELRKSYLSDDGVCDIPHLQVALHEMDDVFSAWLDDQSELVGVARPEPIERPQPVNRQARRQNGRAKKVTARTTNGATKRTTAAAG